MLCDSIAYEFSWGIVDHASAVSLEALLKVERRGAEVTCHFATPDGRDNPVSRVLRRASSFALRRRVVSPALYSRRYSVPDGPYPASPHAVAELMHTTLMAAMRVIHQRDVDGSVTGTRGIAF